MVNKSLDTAVKLVIPAMKYTTYIIVLLYYWLLAIALHSSTTKSGFILVGAVATLVLIKKIYNWLGQE